VENLAPSRRDANSSTACEPIEERGYSGIFQQGKPNKTSFKKMMKNFLRAM